MKYFYSSSTNGAYIDSLNERMPSDAVEIPEALYRKLFTATIDGVVGPGEGGLPILIRNTGPTQEETALRRRDSLLSDATIKMGPLQDAVDLGEATADEEARLAAWKRYRMLLNRIQQQAEFPEVIEWPAVPNVLQVLPS
ncbi:Phage tail fiber protein [Pseudomonas sp. R4-39-08]|uniref:tail fiber assembly protein n=1 Tax=Pseudomonas TaxID=286 RepID=UPI000F564E33|nr:MULTISPECIES: tail fiber assembly protein [Pseudomonas]AZF36252.1 Phage tail fiber protein [Pseudomonas sp. R4-39-08]MDQ0980564.1 hypothetical protein [Pseudomonas synxantha]